MKTVSAETRTIRIETYRCDICEKETPGCTPCYGCGRDLCLAHRMPLDRHPFTNGSLGASFLFLCPACARFFPEVQSELFQEHARHDEVIAALETRWRSACKQHCQEEEDRASRQERNLL